MKLQRMITWRWQGHSVQENSGRVGIFGFPSCPLTSFLWIFDFFGFFLFLKDFTNFDIMHFG